MENVLAESPQHQQNISSSPWALREAEEESRVWSHSCTLISEYIRTLNLCQTQETWLHCSARVAVFYTALSPSSAPASPHRIYRKWAQEVDNREGKGRSSTSCFDSKENKPQGSGVLLFWGKHVSVKT